MDFSFSQFCSQKRSCYAQLRERTDACAATGHSYEFPQCKMPPGCTPPRATLGFWRDRAGGYMLYLRPRVSFSGGGALGKFFGGLPLSFPGFEGLADCLRGLKVAEEAPDGPPLGGLEESLRAMAPGQAQAAEALAPLLRGHVCKSSPARPLSLLFYGPAGSGKTGLGLSIAPALNRALGCELYDTARGELRFFTSGGSVDRGGWGLSALYGAARENPNRVFLFEHVEKARPDALELLLPLLEGEGGGVLSADGEGKAAPGFRRCIFVFTTGLIPEPGRGPAVSLPPSFPEHTRRFFARNEAARLALSDRGVFGELSGRVSALVGFEAPDEEAAAAITARQIMALGGEYGLNIVSVSPEIARALAPVGELSPASCRRLMEQALAPLFIKDCTGSEKGPLYLGGTPEKITLIPA